MIRKLLIVFASGLVLSIVALGAAWVIGGPAIMARMDRDGGSNPADDPADKPVAMRTLAFDGSRILTVKLPVSLRFVRGDKAEMTVSGPAGVIDALRWENGELSLGRKAPLHGRGIEVKIVAPQIAGLVLAAPGEVELRDLDQPSLTIDVRGPASVEATGKVQRLDIEAHGVGSLDLASVQARDAHARIAGVGSVDINASGNVDIDISGAGSVGLHRKPAQLTSRTSGIGSIDHDY